MKLLIIPITALSLMSCSLLPGDDIAVKDVPSVVKNSFTKEYPEALEVEWEKHDENFEVEFEVKNEDYTILYSPSGQELMEKQEISVDALPATITNELKESYADSEIEDAEKIEKEGNTYYQVELEGDTTDKSEVFSEDGSVATNVEYWD